jgi:hypothetical protein
MELSPPWEVASCETTAELPSILWNPKGHNRVHRSPPLVHILSQINPIHPIPFYLSKIHFNIVTTTYVLVFLVVSFFLAFPPISCMHSSSPHSCYMPCPSHPPWVDHSNYTWQGIQVTKFLTMQFFQSPVISSPFCPNILFSTLFSNILSLCLSLSVRYQISHPYRTTGKIIVLYILTFSVL